MFAAQPGIVAIYENACDSASKLTFKPVIAFNVDGFPMVIGNPEDRQNSQLIRADEHEGYLGIVYSPAQFDKIDEHVDHGNCKQVVGSDPAVIQVNSEIVTDVSHKNSFDMTELEIAALEFAALRALEMAGKRQLTNSNRGWRGAMKGVPAWEIHTRIPITDMEKALSGAYDLLQQCLPGRDRLHSAIDSYVRRRLSTQTSHSRGLLIETLKNANCI
ncbi:hypothetical protein [Saccharopolyspora sp. 5N708]|uniref:hypothetical protein n=1 Tax=Saccharopolyspora sp. 5N708 TaxID=3457424 RepID=UPI003FD1349B